MRYWCLAVSLLLGLISCAPTTNSANSVDIVGDLDSSWVRLVLSPSEKDRRAACSRGVYAEQRKTRFDATPGFINFATPFGSMRLSSAVGINFLYCYIGGDKLGGLPPYPTASIYPPQAKFDSPDNIEFAKVSIKAIYLDKDNNELGRLNSILSPTNDVNALNFVIATPQEAEKMNKSSKLYFEITKNNSSIKVEVFKSSFMDVLPVLEKGTQ